MQKCDYLHPGIFMPGKYRDHPRHRYSTAFKLAVLDDLHTSGDPVADVARRHGCTWQAVYQWSKEMRLKRFPVEQEIVTGAWHAVQMTYAEYKDWMVRRYLALPGKKKPSVFARQHNLKSAVFNSWVMAYRKGVRFADTAFEHELGVDQERQMQKQMVEDWKKSGLTMPEFAKRNGIKHTTLQEWSITHKENESLEVLLITAQAENPWFSDGLLHDLMLTNLTMRELKAKHGMHIDTLRERRVQDFRDHHGVLEFYMEDSEREVWCQRFYSSGQNMTDFCVEHHIPLIYLEGWLKRRVKKPVVLESHEIMLERSYSS